MKKTNWYKDVVFYQIYPRSFCDSNGDGIGDINGITSKLDYLKELGIGAVWLSPFYKSPNDDNGYDISDYRDIMDEFGTLSDWKKMADGIHRRGMKLVVDLVVNHSSDEHKWFLESKKSKDNPYRDYYIWKDGKGADGKTPPNGWKACFGGNAWEYDENTKQFYLHLFSKKQPDLNWDNPKLRQEVADICNFWLELGVDGFRCDVITYISKDFVSNGDAKDNFVIGKNWQTYIKELSSASWNNYDTMVVGECCYVNTGNVHKVTGEGLLDSVISFDHIPFFKNYSLPKWKREITRWQELPESAWWSVYLENHDRPRSPSVFIKDGFHSIGAKMLASTMMFLRGTYYVYQGQELGMTNIPLQEDEYRDIQSVNLIKAQKSRFAKRVVLKHLQQRARDHARTPMQWSTEKNAGFSTETPWMKVNPNYTEINVDTQSRDDDSVLSYYKKAISVRGKYTEIISKGDYLEYGKNNKKVFCYTRTLGNKTILVMSSFSHKNVKYALPDEIKYQTKKLIISNYPVSKDDSATFAMKPYEVRVYELTL